MQAWTVERTNAGMETRQPHCTRTASHKSRTSRQSSVRKRVAVDFMPSAATSRMELSGTSALDPLLAQRARRSIPVSQQRSMPVADRADGEPDLISEMLDFFALAERLKTELRHSWLSDGRQESVAEHCWMMALMAFVIAPHLEHKVDLPHALLLILVHDLAEAKVGDIPSFEVSKRKNAKAGAEARAMAEIAAMFSDSTGRVISDLWHEFEASETREARFARALDHLEVQFQHNLAAIETWEPVEHDLVYTKMIQPTAHDAMLRRLAAAMRDSAEDKLAEAGVDVVALRERLGFQPPPDAGCSRRKRPGPDARTVH